MLTRGRAFALGVVLMLAGCVGPGGSTGDLEAVESCLIGGPPRDAPDGREVFNLTHEVLERLPVLSQVFQEEGHTVEVDCQEGRGVFQALRDEGADAVVLEEPTGHNAFLQHEGKTLHVRLWSQVD